MSSFRARIFITDKDLKFYDKISPVFPGKDIRVRHCVQKREKEEMVLAN